MPFVFLWKKQLPKGLSISSLTYECADRPAWHGRREVSETLGQPEGDMGSPEWAGFRFWSWGVGVHVVQDLPCLPHPPAKLVLGTARVLLCYTIKAFPVLAVHPPPHPL